MSSPDQSPTVELPGQVCGNCGVNVQASDIICPACGVLLAAYQAPAGATGDEVIEAALAQLPGDTSATRDVASPAMNASPPPTPATPPEPAPTRPYPPRHQPRSQSPIGDALRQSQQARKTGLDDLGSAEIADELARMATSDSALAREVEAELAGAKVTFDGTGPVIETDQVDITHTGDGAPVVVEHGPAMSRTTASEPVMVSTPQAGARAAPVARSQPIRTTSTVNPVPDDGTLTATVSTPEVERTETTAHFDPATLVRWIPFILIGCFVLGMGRSFPGFGGVFGFTLVIGLIYLLVKVAAASSRKTTSMPRDDRWNSNRSRRRK